MRSALLPLWLCLSAPAQAEPLAEPLQALLSAAAAQNGDAFEEAVTLIALTQPADRIAAGAATISEARGAEARALLGLGSPAASAVAAGSAYASAEEPVAALDAPAPKPAMSGWRRASHQAASVIANGELDLWTGRAQTGLRFDSGNSDRQDYKLAVSAERELVGWGFSAKVDYAYSEVDESVGRDELTAQARSEREAGERWTFFLSGLFERDRLSGFDWGTVASAGAGYRVIDTEKSSWTLRAGPALRTRRAIDGETSNDAALDLESDVSIDLSETLSVRSDTQLLLSEASQASQTVALTTALGSLWSLELAYRYRYEFDPEPGFANEDTRTDLSIVREF